MNIVLSRIDERLVHGQIITSWTKQLLVKRIVIIDSLIAKDSFMTQVLTLAAPSGVTVDIFSVEDALSMLNNETTSVENTMLLFRKIESVLDLVKSGFNLKELNVGNMGAGPRRKSISRNVYMTPEEIEVVKDLINIGVYVYLQMLHTDAKIDIKKQI